MKNINNIVKSELVVRTNNVKFRQEYGEVGVSPNITTEGQATLFKAEFKINKVVYLSVNGVNLIEGKHYEVISDYVISISNLGDPLKQYPGLKTSVLLGYHFVNKRSSVGNSIGAPPTITYFTLNAESGGATEIIFNFLIDQAGGKNIYWSIIKDGSDTPLFQGSDLFTNNGYVVDSSGTPYLLSDTITQEEYEARQGETIPYTFMVIYDLTNDGSSLDEKLLASATYTLGNITPITGSLVNTPTVINTTDRTKIEVAYAINVSMGTSPTFTWRLVRSSTTTLPQTVLSGNQGDMLSGVYEDFYTAVPAEHSTMNYALELSLDSSPPDSGTYSTLATSKTTISIASIAETGWAGYMDASLPVVTNKTEYINTVQREFYTEEMQKSIINNSSKPGASVYDPNGTIDWVYPIYEIPNSWGNIFFHNGTGAVDMSFFTVIPLDNGYTGYVYKQASGKSNRTDFYIKK